MKWDERDTMKMWTYVMWTHILHIYTVDAENGPEQKSFDHKAG